LHVTTAEGLIPLIAQPKNRELLETYLDVSSTQLDRVLFEVKAQLDSQLVQELLRADPGGPRQGVLDRIPEEKRSGHRRS
jgi:hypothetical protein